MHSMNFFLVYELVGVLVFLIALIIKRKLNVYVFLFVILFFLMTYFILPFINVHWATHRYFIRIGSTLVAGAITYGVYLLNIRRRCSK